MDKVMRGHLRSTYQYDYTGIPQGSVISQTETYIVLGVVISERNNYKFTVGG